MTDGMKAIMLGTYPVICFLLGITIGFLNEEKKKSGKFNKR